MIKLISKLGTASGLLTTTFVVDLSSSNLTQSKQKNIDLEGNKPDLGRDDIQTVKDILLLEKAYGCAFGFVASWSGKKVYTAEEFLKQEKSTNKTWTDEVLRGVKHEVSINKCKNKEKITLFFGDNHNGFFPDKPSQGW